MLQMFKKKKKRSSALPTMVLSSEPCATNWKRKNLCRKDINSTSVNYLIYQVSYVLAERRAAFSIHLQSKAKNERFCRSSSKKVGFLNVAVRNNDNESKYFSWTVSCSVVFPPLLVRYLVFFFAFHFVFQCCMCTTLSLCLTQMHLQRETKPHRRPEFSSFSTSLGQACLSSTSTLSTMAYETQLLYASPR